MTEPIVVPPLVADTVRHALAERDRRQGLQGMTRTAALVAYELAAAPVTTPDTVREVAAWHQANPEATLDDGRSTLLAGVWGGRAGRDWALSMAARLAAPSYVDPNPEKPAEVVAAGVAIVAADTGRVLMLQRALDPEDPAGGKWEFPGGHIDDGEGALEAAKREFAEEVGTEPVGELAGDWVSPNGVYHGFILVVPDESAVACNLDAEDRQVLNPDDPDGDGIEVVAWWHPADADGNPVVREECRAATPWDQLAGVARARQASLRIARRADGRAGRDADGDGIYNEDGDTGPQGAKATKDVLDALKPRFAAAAQAVYDEWEQDEEGYSEEYGGGGICDAISAEMSGVVSEGTFAGEVTTHDGAAPGDDHAWMAVVDRETGEVWGVDIPANVYETGGGYSWTKKPGVTILPEHVEVWKLDVSADEFGDEWSDYDSSADTGGEEPMPWDDDEDPDGEYASARRAAAARPRYELIRFSSKHGRARTAAIADPLPVLRGNPGQAKLKRVSRRLAKVDRDLRAQLAAGAEVAMADGLRRAGVKVTQRAARRSKAVQASVGGCEGVYPPAVLAAAGITEQEALAHAFDSFAAKAERWIERAQRRKERILAEDLALDANARDRARRRWQLARGVAVGVLVGGLTRLAITRLTKGHPHEPDGEDDGADVLVPGGLIGDAIAAADGKPVSGDPAAGTAEVDKWAPGVTFDVITDQGVRVGIITDGSPVVERIVWRWNDSERPFDPHLDLDGSEATADTIGTVWAKSPEEFPYNTTYWFPGDHHGCKCSWDSDFVSAGGEAVAAAAGRTAAYPGYDTDEDADLARSFATGGFDEAKHPRHAKGTSRGGEFAPKEAVDALVAKTEASTPDIGVDLSALSPEDAATAQQQLDELPDNVRALLARRGVKIEARPRASYSARGQDYGAFYDSDTRTVVVSPKAFDPVETAARPADAPVMLHELGHAYDYAVGGVSMDPAFRAVWKDAIKGKWEGSYFARAFGGSNPRRELFAEAAARRWTGMGDHPDFAMTSHLDELVDGLVEVADERAVTAAMVAAAGWDESLHPRHAKGSEGGGRFAEKDRAAAKELLLARDEAEAAGDTAKASDVDAALEQLAEPPQGAPSSAASSQLLTDLPEPQRAAVMQSISEVEAAAATDPTVEHGILVAPDGTTTGLLHGEKHGVQLIGKGVSAKGAIGIHSHPGYGGRVAMSGQDVKQVVSWGTAGTVVIGSGDEAGQWNVLRYNGVAGNYREYGLMKGIDDIIGPATRIPDPEYGVAMRAAIHAWADTAHRMVRFETEPS